MPSTASASCHRISGRSGEPKFRQSVTPPGRAPAQETFRAASHTAMAAPRRRETSPDRKSTRLNSSHGYISYAVFCLKKKKQTQIYQAMLNFPLPLILLLLLKQDHT